MRRMTGNKFGAKKIIDPATGFEFDSKKEFYRWCELRIMERAGKIRDLKRQVTYELIPSQREESTEVYKAGPHKGLPKPGAVIEKPCNYIADFVYQVPTTTQYENEVGHLAFADGYETVVEDVKGYKKGAAYQLFSCKRKLMLQVHGIRVREV
jgi:hypothetical protein